MRRELIFYIKNSVKIRVLSAVTIKPNTNKNEYINELRKAYQEIGELGKICRQTMETSIYPLLKDDRKLTIDEIEELQEFCDKLLVPSSGEDLDLSLLYEISKKLLSELVHTNEYDMFVNQLHTHISVCYANMNRTARITVTKELTEFYKKDGLLAAEELKKFMVPDMFVKLSMESKNRLLRGIRFYSALYDTFYTDEECNEKRYQALKDGVALYSNSFYRENIEGYDWETHLFRCLEHMGQLTERGNRWCFTKEQCIEICDYIKKLEDLWNNEAFGEEILPEVHLRLIQLRNSFFAGKIDKNEYKNKLLDLYKEYASFDYDMYSVQANLLIPVEYLNLVDATDLSPKEERTINSFYDHILMYIKKSINVDAFNYLQEYLLAFLENFIEIPGGITYQEMCLKCIAALHPPTFVHSIQVAAISKTLTRYLLSRNPEIFVGGKYPDVEAVINNKSRILQYIHNVGLCHDFGKLALIDTIFMYGRKLFDLEFKIIKAHSIMSGEMLSKYASTKKYATSARNHHIWYNGYGGYPEGEKPDIYAQIITIADCLDAATDSVGRSYNAGKTIDDVKNEFIKDSGIKYNPIIVDLFNDPEVLDDLNYHINEGRISIYGETFQMLNGVGE